MTPSLDLQVLYMTANTRGCHGDALYVREQ